MEKDCKYALLSEDIKMILTTTGCYGTGSSAITDLIKEFDGVTCVSDNEIRLLYDPDGVSDLEYSLVENPNRHNSSQSIKRFMRRMEEMDHILFVSRFKKYFGEEFLNVINAYIEKLTVNKYKGTWHFDVYDRGKWFYVFSRTYAKCTTLLAKVLHTRISELDPVLEREYAYLSVTEEREFLSATKQLVDDLARMINKDKNEFVFMDQLVPPSNFERYIRYFSDVRIVLVERDPRDIFILEKEIWKGRVAPVTNVEDFCKWYIWTRQLYEKNRFPEQVLFVQFEDMIYRYDETRQKVIKHFGIERLQCKRQKEYFDPARSVVNTRLWEKIGGFEKEIQYIEKHLIRYCYNYNNVHEIKGNGKQKVF